MEYSNYICPYCKRELFKIQLYNEKPIFICGRCNFILKQTQIIQAIKREEKIRRLYTDNCRNGSIYLKVLRESILSKCAIVFDLYCPICKTETFRETWDGRKICSRCLFTLDRKWNRKYPNSLIDKVRKRRAQGATLKQLVYELTLPIHTVKNILY